MEKNVQCKQQSQKRMGGYTNIRKQILKENVTRRETFHDDKRENLSEGYNNVHNNRDQNTGSKNLIGEKGIYAWCEVESSTLLFCM